MNMVTLVMHSSMAFTLLADGRPEFVLPPKALPNRLPAGLSRVAVGALLYLRLPPAPVARATMNGLVGRLQFVGVPALPMPHPLLLRLVMEKPLPLLDPIMEVRVLLF